MGLSLPRPAGVALVEEGADAFAWVSRSSASRSALIRARSAASARFSIRMASIRMQLNSSSARRRAISAASSGVCLWRAADRGRVWVGEVWGGPFGSPDRGDRLRAFAAKSWRAGRGAGPSPGVLCFEYRFDEGLTPRANGWPASSGRRAVAVLSPNPISLRRVGGPCEEPSRVRSSIPLDPPPAHHVSPSARRDFTPAPVPSAPAAARSQALRALQATRPGVIIGDGGTLAGKSGRETDKPLESLE